MASCSIGHAVLLNLVRDSIDDPLLLDLVAQYLHRTVDENCLYSTVTIGISLGCPLSPVMAALYVEPLDRRMEATGLTYARFHRANGAGICVPRILDYAKRRNRRCAFSLARISRTCGSAL